jgi:hypothetical protein
VATLLGIVDRLRQRFAIPGVCVIADRAVISAATLAAPEECGLEYILGVLELSVAVAKLACSRTRIRCGRGTDRQRRLTALAAQAQ